MRRPGAPLYPPAIKRRPGAPLYPPAIKKRAEEESSGGQRREQWRPEEESRGQRRTEL